MAGLVSCFILSGHFTLVGVFHVFVFLAIQMQKEHSMDTLANDLDINLACLLLKPNFLREYARLFDGKPLAPISTAKKSAIHPLEFIIVTRDWYLQTLVLCQASMFSSHGHVNSIITIRLMELEYTTRSGRS